MGTLVDKRLKTWVDKQKKLTILKLRIILTILPTDQSELPVHQIMKLLSPNKNYTHLLLHTEMTVLLINDDIEVKNKRFIVVFHRISKKDPGKV